MSGLKNFCTFASRRKNNGLVRCIAGAVLFLLFLAVLDVFALPIKNGFYLVSSPLEKIFWSAGKFSSDFLSSLSSAGSLANENQTLRQENQKLLSEIAFLQSLEQADRAQDDILKFNQNMGLNLVMGSVVGLDDNDMLSIDKGSIDGISEGMPVINQQNVLFGRIFKVYKNFSQIMLITNRNSTTIIEIQDNAGLQGAIKGSGGLNAYLDLVPINSNINSGDILLTSATDPSFPKNLLVGEISKVEKNDQNPHQQAQISLFFDVKTADNLFIITNYKR